MKTLIKNGTIINADKSIKAALLLEDEQIAAIIEDESKINELETQANRVLDASAKLIFAGLIDMHVHFRDPGQEYKDDIYTGCAAAAAGGVTTAACMANTKPVNDNPLIAKYMINKANECGLIDLLPISAITKASQGEKLVDMGKMLEAGCVAFSDDGLPVSNS